MRKRYVFLAMVMLLLAAVTVCAADSTFEGDISIKGKLADVNGSEAKFNEYRDIRDGIYGGVRLRYDSEDFFLKARAADIAYDTQNYEVEGGMWGKFKLDVNYTEIPHNFTYGASTFYSGSGSDRLTYTVAPTSDTSGWNRFDYNVKRKTFGAGAKIDVLKPFFLDISASREKRDGTYPIGVAATSPGGIGLELPAPVDYTTDSFKVEAGYAKNPFFAAISFMYSEFENDNENLFFRNPGSGTQPNTDAFTLPPDNQYYRLGFRGSVKLPLNSKFNLNLSKSRTKSESDLFTSSVSSGITNYSLSDAVFDGKIDTSNYHAVLTTNPVPFFIGKAFFKYYDKKNRSDEITTTNLSSGNSFTNRLTDFQKINYGVEAGFRIPYNFFLSAGFSHINMHRNRDVLLAETNFIPRTKDDIHTISLKWTGLDFIVPKVGYEHLKRTGKQEGAGVAPFDTAAKNVNVYKAGLEIYPLENLNFGIEYKNRKEYFQNSPIGISSLKGDELNIDAGYTIGRIAQVNAYFDYDMAKSFQFQTSGGSVGNWDLRQKDKSIAYGAGGELYLVPKILTLILQYNHVKSDGLADFTLFNPTPPDGRNNDNIDINNWDDYKKDSFIAKVKYSPWKAYTLIAGYAYERYKYDDAQWDGYTLVPATTGSNGAFLTGAYADQSYRAHVLFLGLTYHF